MIDWAIGFLEGFRDSGAFGQLAFAGTILSPLILVFGLTRHFARRGYRTSTALTDDLAIARDEVANLTRANTALERENTTLTARLPEAFIERLDAQIAQGNEDPATRDVYDLLSEFAPALTAAYAHLAREEAKNVATTEDAREQAMLYRLARDNARIALAFTPDHAEMAALEEELSTATAAAEQGLTVLPTDDAIRALRWKSRMDRDRSVPVLMAVWRRNIDRGAYHLALSAAKEARRLASRGGAELSRDALFAAYAMAQTQMVLGAYGAALSLAQTTAQQQTQAFEANNPHTLVTRYLVASILMRKGEYDAALAEAEAVRAAQEAHPDVGANGHHTLTTRHLIADLLLRKGDHDAALEEAEAVRSAQEVHPDVGADHPNTLTTRYLIAEIFLRQGDDDAALAEAKAVHTTFEAHPDIGAEHPDTLRARLLVAEIHHARGDNSAARAGLVSVKPKIEALDLAEGHRWLKAMASLEAALAEAGETPEKC